MEIPGRSGAGTAVADPRRFEFRQRAGDAWGRTARGEDYLFKLQLTKNVKRPIERAMREQDWQDAGRRWQGKDNQLRLEGWSRQRRIVILLRRLQRSVAMY
jgi:hypothetical protein